MIVAPLSLGGIMIRIVSAFLAVMAIATIGVWPHNALAQEENYSDYNLLEFVIPEGKVLRRTTKTTTTQIRDGKTTTGSYTGIYDLHITFNDDHYVVTKA